MPRIRPPGIDGGPAARTAGERGPSAPGPPTGQLVTAGALGRGDHRRGPRPVAVCIQSLTGARGRETLTQRDRAWLVVLLSRHDIRCCGQACVMLGLKPQRRPSSGRSDVSNRAKVIVGSILVGVGVLLSLLPKDWIEERFGFEPDAGNGLLELALILVPIVLGAGLLVAALIGGTAQSRHRMAGGTDGNEESR